MLLNDICVRLGWCGGIVDGEPSHVDMFIPASGPVTAAQVAEWVIRAEGLDPVLTPRRHRRYLKDAFVRHMGAGVVDATELKWNAP